MLGKPWNMMRRIRKAKSQAPRSCDTENERTSFGKKVENTEKLGAHPQGRDIFVEAQVLVNQWLNHVLSTGLVE